MGMGMAQGRRQRSELGAGCFHRFVKALRGTRHAQAEPAAGAQHFHPEFRDAGRRQPGEPRCGHGVDVQQALILSYVVHAVSPRLWEAECKRHARTREPDLSRK